MHTTPAAEASRFVSPTELPHRIRILWLKILLIPGLLVCLLPFTAAQDQLPRQQQLEREYEASVQPLLRRYCHECHSTERAEAEIDFSQLQSFAENRGHLPLWISVREVLDQRQMPPEEAGQPTESERAALLDWTRAYLRTVATATEGDPGAVELRRLTNAQYNYVLRDLTGVQQLDLTREFPVDGAAGEGFTNTGSGQALSPSMIDRYLQAAREVADHLVLLPDGIRFSSSTTRRDHTDEIVQQLRTFYDRFTDDSGGSAVDIQGIPLETNTGGRLPVQQSLQALWKWQEGADRTPERLRQLAQEQSLSPKYLARLSEALHADSEETSELWSPLGELRRRWSTAAADDLPDIVAFVQRVQNQLWTFHTIGHIGRADGPQQWMDRRSPLIARQEIRLPLPSSDTADSTALWLSAIRLDGAEQPVPVLWHRPRLEYREQPGRPALLLKDIVAAAPVVTAMQQRELARIPDYLALIADVSSGRLTDADIEPTIQDHKLNQHVFAKWARLTGLETSAPIRVTGHFTSPLTGIQGHAEINGWGSESTPSLLTNTSDQTVNISTLSIPPRGVVVHPAPNHHVFVAWQAPMAGTVSLQSHIADADGNCGNGVQWQLQAIQQRGTGVLTEGTIENGGAESAEANDVVVDAGDVVLLRVMARANNHVCDTTSIGLEIRQSDGSQRTWSLSRDLVDDILTGNPLPDGYGNSNVWHVGQQASEAAAPDLIPADSVLSAWREALHRNAPADELNALADRVRQLLTAGVDNAVSESDARLKQVIFDWQGPMDWLKLAARGSDVAVSAPSGMTFGERPDGQPTDPASLMTEMSAPIRWNIPWPLNAGAEFVVDGELVASEPNAPVVQLQIATSPAEPTPPAQPDLTAPLLVVPDSDAARRMESELEAFRQLFPAALCYRRIIPVDETVTLNLYYREDAHLQRLMLTDDEIAELDRMWEELLYVSQEPLQLTVAFEQISEFATQDRPDLVTAFSPLREPILRRAEEFREQLKASEPAHLRALERWATQAWRAPPSEFDASSLRALYHDLRATGFEHDAAMRRLVTRILVSPAFLFRLEQTPAGVRSDFVSSHELASRLSFFLWSSLPDSSLRESAESGRLSATLAADPAAGQDFRSTELIGQTRRMLQDPRCRRMAEQFACQWLHVRNFSQQNDKNERLYPQFAALRGAMYEETVRFFDDLIRHNGSVLDILNAEHAFLNEQLAEHYQIPGVTGTSWRRVDNVDRYERGGVLGMATVLASQSGASRTSPILRGNWISETLLGERLPRPPANVPQLPDALPEGLTSRQLIELHSGQPQCAHCHEKIDVYGFALEQFDTIGRTRGEPADTTAVLPDGTEVRGFRGLRDYLTHDRRDAFVRQFCRKLLGYALGRAVQLSDEPLLEDMQQRLEAQEFRIHGAIETIVLSRQFRMIRGSEWRDEAVSH